MRKAHAAAVAAVCTALALSSCGDDTAGDDAGDATNSTPIRVVVDTDAGLDDAIALLYLATSPDVDLQAVTVSGTGLAHCFPGTLNVVGLLELVGRPDVPVACGREEALGTADVLHPFPSGWRSGADGRYGNTWPIGAGAADDRTAAELLVDTVAGTDSPVTLVSLGPLTNIADALTLDPDMAGGVERLVAMGGAFEVAGNTADAEAPPERNVAEWNIYADPRAARDVVQAGLPFTFVPLDATNQVPLDAYLLRAAASAPSSEAVRVTNALLANVRELIGAGDYYLWDPLAAVLALHPELGTQESGTVEVVTEGAESGRTVAGATGTPAEIVTSADGRAAEEALLEGLAGAPVPAIDERPDLVIDPLACRLDRADLDAGPRVVQLDPVEASHVVVIGTLEAGRGAADIEAYLAAPTEEGPEWFRAAAFLGGATDTGPITEMVEFDAGEYAAVCLQGNGPAADLVGTTTITVSR